MAYKLYRSVEGKMKMIGGVAFVNYLSDLIDND